MSDIASRLRAGLDALRRADARGWRDQISAAEETLASLAPAALDEIELLQARVAERERFILARIAAETMIAPPPVQPVPDLSEGVRAALARDQRREQLLRKFLALAPRLMHGEVQDLANETRAELGEKP